MKVTKSYIKQLVKEELNRVLSEVEVVKSEDKPQELMQTARDMANSLGRPNADAQKTDPGHYWAWTLLSQFGGKSESSPGHGSVENFKSAYQQHKTRMVGEDRAKLYQYEFRDIWPVNVSNIDLSYDTSDTIEEFTVEFAVQTIVRRPDNQIVS